MKVQASCQSLFLKFLYPTLTLYLHSHKHSSSLIITISKCHQAQLKHQYSLSALLFNLHSVLWTFISQAFGYHYKDMPPGTAAASHFLCDTVVLTFYSSFQFAICFWTHDVALKILRISVYICNNVYYILFNILSVLS